MTRGRAALFLLFILRHAIHFQPPKRLRQATYARSTTARSASRSRHRPADWQRDRINHSRASPFRSTASVALGYFLTTENKELRHQPVNWLHLFQKLRQSSSAVPRFPEAKAPCLTPSPWPAVGLYPAYQKYLVEAQW